MNTKSILHLRKTRLALQLVPVVTLLVTLATFGSISAQTVTTFDAPGAGTGAFQGTYPFNIAPTGAIIGWIRDAGNVRHGFIRSSQGDFTIFDAPNAGTGAGQGTRAYAANPSGQITGWYLDGAGAAHGFVRSRQGQITSFDAPGAGTGPYPEGTFPWSPLIINPNGAIAGWYTDSDLVSHGFLRERDGSFATFDAPGAGTGAGQGTFGYAISAGELITGYYYDSADVSHGFLRYKNGTIITFDVPGSGTDPFLGTYGGGFSPNGVVMGNYFGGDTLSHGFLFDKTGNFTTFDAPDAGSVPGSFEGTYPFGINPSGAITGWYIDGSDVNHGFVRDPNGGMTEFDVPGAGTGPGQGPYPFSIAPNGAATGYSYDSGNVVHGFLYSP